MKQRTILLCLSLVCASTKAIGQTATLDENWWVTDGAVFDIVLDPINDRAYLGGSFSTVGPALSFGAKITYPGTAPDLAYDKPNGRVLTVISDGGGGWYIGGTFSEVGGLPRNKIAKLLPTGGVDPDWDPAISSSITGVYALALDAGGNLFVGGEFNSLGGSNRRDLVKIPSGSSAADATFPENGSGTGDVRALLVVGSTLYVGGSFNNIGVRQHLARIDLANGTVDPWDPQPSGVVRALAWSGTTLYAGGSFSTVGSPAVARQGAAAFDAAGDPTAWDPSAWGSVHAVLPSPQGIFIGGDFPFVNSSGTNVPRSMVACVDPLTGVATTWAPADANEGEVRGLSMFNGSLLVSGEFNGSFGGRASVVALDPVTAALGSWDPVIGGPVDALSTFNNDLYVAGNFSTVGGVRRHGLAAIDLTTGQATAFGAAGVSTPNGAPAGGVTALHLEGPDLFIGGQFTHVAGAPRASLAALDVTSGNLLPWAPTTTGPFGGGDVRAFCKHGSVLYVAGWFDSLGGSPRSNLGAFDLQALSNTPTAWAPDPDGPVLALIADGTHLYAGGGFSSVGGAAMQNLAKLDPNLSPQNVWGSGCNGVVRTLAFGDGTLYVGGDFTTLGGAGRANIGRVDPETGIADSWFASVSGSVGRLSLHSTGVLACGSFEFANGAYTPGLVFLGRTSAAAAGVDFHLSTGTVINSAAVLPDDRVAFGGAWSADGRNNLGFLTLSCTPVPSFADLDGDGFGDGSGHFQDGAFGCTVPPGYVPTNSDCDDTNADINPGSLWYEDLDGDGYGSWTTEVMQCEAPPGYIDTPTDCDDTDPLIFNGHACDDGDVFNGQNDFIHAITCLCHGDATVIDLRTNLQGPYDGNSGLMRDDLRSAGLVPTMEPYTAAGYNFTLGAGAFVLPSVLAVAGSSAVVDWVVVEVRQGEPPHAIQHSRPALLLRDGRVVELDGTSMVKVPLVPGNWEVAVRHRNHLPVMSAGTYSSTFPNATVDLTLASTATYGTEARCALPNGVFGQWQGNVLPDNSLKYTGSLNDRDPILIAVGGTIPTATISGVYSNSDSNMDATIKYTGAGNDRDPILINIGGTVPTAQRQAQTP
ncbi:MAG: hypothetical protein IPJ76_03165 [Flavobacteriales bacterium]|nr:MAG: hypothetical protein IPJ76_03165 [Flavobacteriales bacterium]